MTFDIKEKRRVRPHEWPRVKRELNTSIVPDWVSPTIKLERGDGKTCAIVGNARSILNKNNGSIIDAHNIVVRINIPRVENIQCQGSRCDILFAAPVALRRVEHHEVKTLQLIVINTHIIDLFTRWTNKLRQDIGCEKARPTTGFMAIVQMAELGYNISIFGFDWFETPSLNDPNCGRRHGKVPSVEETMWKHHHPRWEKQQIEQILLQNIIR